MSTPLAKRLRLLDRYLTVVTCTAMAAGPALGYAAPGVRELVGRYSGPAVLTPSQGASMSALNTLPVAPPSCCGPTCCTAEDTKAVIRQKYAAVAESGLSGRHAGVHAVAEAFGYSAAELASIPAEANMGLSCGNPTATANLRPGETVVDLGCGGGLDVLLAARQVGPRGKAIGIDMTPAMIDRATKNAAGIGNVVFLLATIDRLPLPDASVDCIISNCVINLAPDKNGVFREAARVLKPGGRFAVSDIALKKPLPPELASDVAALVGCIAGAIPIEDFRTGLTAAGFAAVEVIDSKADLNAYAQVEGQAGCCSPAMGPTARGTDGPGLHAGLSAVLAMHDVNEFAASVKVFAVKPA